MSPAALSMFCFGIYVVVAGLFFLIFPTEAMRQPHSEAAFEPIRMFGLVTAVLGYYYVYAARHERELRSFFQLSVFGRGMAVPVMVFMAVTGLANPPLLIVALIDSVGAFWTFLALRRTQPG